MSLSMHTKGPWKLDAGRSVDGKCFDGTYRTICSPVRGGNPREADANARLIAAAPEMYEALTLIWSMFDDGRIVRNIANDGKPDWALKMLEFTRELQTVHSLIQRLNDPRKG